MTPRLPILGAAIAEFCHKWQITEFALFGSVLRDDFGPDSDVDVLVAFAPSARHSLFDLVRSEDDLSEIVGRGDAQLRSQHRRRHLSRSC